MTNNTAADPKPSSFTGLFVFEGEPIKKLRQHGFLEKQNSLQPTTLNNDAIRQDKSYRGKKKSSRQIAMPFSLQGSFYLEKRKKK